ncbi:T9SS type A sorting domain-containing protein [candidate division WOR-3 bacterium]|uniref:T9SS type A sorting domain-containing protein n=1 Tax=candidate division WOR-3 bacterium TaxID=2052148 RepID=A0A937XEL0_UNCW3|nr:T9SS type A sorting domain-containing protein [candidate division WOR-3 bacterium]
MSGRIRFALLFAVAVLSLPTAEGRQLRLVKSQRRSIPGEAAQAARFLQSYTTLQEDEPAFERFRFKPTDADLDRIRKLQAGGTDTVRVLCLRVEFLSDTTPLTTGNGKMDTLGFLSPDSGLFYDPPHFKRYFERQMEGLRNYYLAQSLGKLYVEFTVMPSGEKTCYQLPREMQFYGDTISFAAVEVGLVRLMRDAFKVADEDPELHFGDYDEFIVFHAGSGLQSDFGLRNDSPFDLLAGEIPSGAIQAYLGEPHISVDSGRTHIEQGTVLPEMMRQDTMYEGQTNILGMTGLAGTLFHEFAHLLGAYDLYDVTGATMGVGGWSLMGYGSWLGDYGAGAPPGVVPGFLDAYHRTLFLDTISQVRTVRVPMESIPIFAAEMDTELFSQRGDSLRPTIVKIPISPEEYFLIENRQVDVKQPDTIDVDVEDGVVIAVGGSEYDFFQPGSGLLIWHIDRRVLADYGPFNAVNIDPARKGVDLEEGDGVQDFDVPYWQSRAPNYEVYGHKYDPFSKGGYNDSFTAYTNPNTDAYKGRSYIGVRLLGAVDSTAPLKDTVISVKVGWDLYQPGFPKVVGNTPFLSAFAADMDGNDTLDIAVIDAGGGLKMWRSNGSALRPPLSIGATTRADIAIGDVAGDSRLEVVAAGNDTLVTVVPVSGAPTRIKVGDRVFAAPVLADLDGDGKKEIIVGSTDMKLYAWKGDGSLMPGFPVAVGSEIRAAVAVTDTVRPRIVLLSGDGRLFLYEPDGSLVSGFPVVLSISPFYAKAQPLVADFDRDGSREIAAVAGGEHDYRLYVVGLDGTVKFRSREFIRSPFTGTLSAADMDGDLYPDVLAASMNDLFALNRSGNLVSNYPFTQESTYTTTELAGNWIITVDVYFQYASSPVVADVDGDGGSDLIIGSPEYGLLGLDGTTGKPLPFFPLMATAGISAVPLAVDLDGDGKLELAAGDDSGTFYVWKMPGPASGIKWPCAYHDACHTGLILESELPPWQPRTHTGLVDKLYVYPNPAGSSVNVRYHLHDADEVKLRLLDMAGEPVGAEFDGQAVKDADNETTVDLKKITPGTYVVRLEAKRPGRREVKFTKLAVIR